MKYTNNYNLKMPEQTDYINVDDFNYNFIKIDKQIREEIDKIPPINDATDISTGVVKIDKTEGEEAPHTVPTIGRLEEITNSVDTKMAEIDSEIELKADKTYVDNKVKTDVPENAKFTDTIVDISGKLSKSNDTLETYTEKVQATTGIINLSLANVFTDTPSASRTYSITNAKSGVAHSFTLIITMGATVRTLTFPASVKWQGGEIPDMTTVSKTYVLTFLTVNGGTNWLGMFGGEF